MDHKKELMMIKDLMDKLVQEMEPNASDFDEALGRKAEMKPEIKSIEIEGVMPEEEMEMEESEDMEEMPEMEDEDGVEMPLESDKFEEMNGTISYLTAENEALKAELSKINKVEETELSETKPISFNPENENPIHITRLASKRPKTIMDSVLSKLNN